MSQWVNKACTRCELHRTCKQGNIPGRGRFGGVLVVVDHPRAKENETGEGFTDKAGELLKALMKDAGWKGPVWLTHALRCSPPKDKATIDHIRTCRAYLDRELSQVKPKMIIALGANACRSLTDNHTASIAKLAGTKGVYQGIPVFFSQSPAAILYDRRIKQYLDADLVKAREWMEAGCPESSQQNDYDIQPLTNLLKAGNLHRGAIDLETEGFDPYAPNARIMSIAVAIPGTVYYSKCECLPNSTDWHDVLKCLYPFQMQIYHNAPYDLAWMTKGLKPHHWMWRVPKRDSMIALQFVDEHSENTSLSYLSSVHCGLPKLETPAFVKAGFPAGWKTLESMKALEEYNCRDSRVTLELETKLVEMFNHDDKAIRAYQWVCENIDLVTRMRHSGIKLHQGRLEKLYVEMSGFIRVAERKLSRAGIDWTKRTDLINHLFTRLKLPVIKKTKTGAICVDAEVLETLIPMDKTGFLETLAKHRGYTKVRDTYCSQMRRWGSIAHPRVFIARVRDGGDHYGANTGRVTTEGFVNLPRGEEDPDSIYALVKRVLTSRYGKEGVIVSADGGQMEMRVLADLSRDRRMLGAFEMGEDLHRYVAGQLYGVKRSEVTKEQRQVGKHYSFRTVYGGTSLESAKKAGINLTPEQDTALNTRYFQRFDGVAAFIKGLQAEAMDRKRIYSPIGRPFHLDNALNKFSKDLRKATNSPIQSGANDFTTEALKQVQAFIDRMSFRAHVILTVYDSIVTDWHREDWEQVDVEYFKREILTNMVKKRFQSLGWDVKVPIEWDLKVGPSLGECE